MKKTQLFLIALITCTLWQCANIVTPSGGAKDEIAPVLDTVFPINKSLEFSSEQIVFHFNEYIQISDIFNQLIISPPVEEFPDVSVKGKKLIVKLKNELRDSTTYTLNFGESIKDITEGNILENFTYVFSTGNELDSLKLDGIVNDVITGDPKEKVYVLLYPNTSDTLFTTSKPYYFAKTNSSGQFNIENIKEGKYFIYALEDQNFNFYYDLPNEKIAFKNEEISIDSNLRNIQLALFQEQSSEQKFLGAKSFRYGQVSLFFASNTKNFSINSESEFLLQKNKTEDTITFWMNNVFIDTQSLEIRFNDIDTSLTIPVKSIPKDSSISKMKNAYTINIEKPVKGSSQSANRAPWDLNKNLEITFQNPLSSFTDSLITIKDDSLQTNLNAILKLDSSDLRKIIVSAQWLQFRSYDVMINQNASKDIFGITNDSASFKIKTKKAADYAQIILKIKTDSSEQIIFELLDKKLNIIKSELISGKTENKFIFSYLYPDSYKMRIIKDSNKNGKWDTGNYENKSQPEQIIYYNQEIATKSNWEIELNWDTTQ